MPITYKRNCNWCGAYYEGQGKYFCSMSCRMKQRNHLDNPAKHPEARKKIAESRKGKPTTLGLKCPYAKKRKIAKALRGRKLSPEHIESIRKAMTPQVRAKIKKARQRQVIPSGPDNPNWKGGHAKARQARYGEPEYITFVKSVLERDHYTCQYCGARNGMGEEIVLQVHHKIPYWQNLNLAYDIDNGITLCKPCHQKAHKGLKKSDVPTYKGKRRYCVVCGKEFQSKPARKYCKSCHNKYCCPVCGSTCCNHSARKLNCSPLPQLA